MSENLSLSLRNPRNRDWTQGNIVHNLLSLSWPMVLGNSLNIMGPTIDMIWVGRLGSTDIAAVGVSGIVVQLINALSMGLFTGLRSMIARYIGARNPAAAVNVARQAFILSGIYSVILALIGIFFAEPMLRVIGLEDDVIALGAPYLRIQLIGIATISFRMLSDGIMQSSGDTMTPLKIAVIFRIVHIVLCPFLVFGWVGFPRLEINGAAITSIISQSLGTILGLWILSHGKSRLRFNFKGIKIDPPTILRIIRIGVPASVMALQMQFGTLLLTRVVVPFGTLAVAAHTIGQRIDMLLFMPLMGLGISSGVLVGQNLGAHQPGRAEKNGWVSLALAEGFMLSMAMVVFFGAKEVVHIFSSDPELDNIGILYLKVASLGYAVSAFSSILQQCIAGAGDTIPPMIISIISIWVIQVPLAVLLTRFESIGLYGVRWAMVAGFVSGAIAYVIYFRSGRWKHKKI